MGLIRVTAIAFVAVALVGCQSCKEQKSTDAVQRKHLGKAPAESDCAKKNGKCVAREEERDCKDSFYSHACADLESDQPICCISGR